MTNEELVEKIQAGDDSLTLQLFNQNRGFINLRARKLAPLVESRPDCEMEDLMQSAFFAVVEAAKVYDPEKGAFLTLLEWKLSKAFRDACSAYTAAQRQDPINSSLRLEKPISDDDSAVLGDTVPDQRNGIEEAEEAIYNEYVTDAVHKAVDSLNDEQQRLCIDMRYFQGKTQKEISELWNVSGQYVSQVERLGLRRIREGEHIQELSEIYYGSRDYFRGTGLTAYRQTGTSSPERELLRKERFERWCTTANKKLSRERKVNLLVEYLNYSPSLAEWRVDAIPEYDYSNLLLLERMERA